MHKASGYAWEREEDAPGYAWKSKRAREEASRAWDSILEKDKMITRRSLSAEGRILHLTIDSDRQIP